MLKPSTKVTNHTMAANFSELAYSRSVTSERNRST